MDKELIDRAWACLPREFREEVKKEYYDCKHCNADACAMELEIVFGRHNLTSDAEGEEMLTVPRNQIQMWYASTKKINDPSSKDYINGVLNTLDTLFGSKCLPDELNEDNFTKSEIEPPYFIKDGVAYRMLKGNNGFVQKEIDKVDDEEPQPAEPKESPRQFYRVMGTDEHGRQVVIPIPPQLAGPYDISKERTEPEASTCTETCTDDCSSQDSYISPAPINFDEIERRDRNYQRLNIATQMASAYIHSEGMTDPSSIATIAFQLADALIAECEKKGGSDE